MTRETPTTLNQRMTDSCEGRFKPFPPSFIHRSLVILIACFLAVVSTGQLFAQTTPKKIEGHWENGASTYRYKFEINFEPKEEFDGYILWTLLKSPNDAEKRKIGLQGKEFVKGNYNSQTRRLSLKGYQKEDPHNILGLDEYRLELSSDGNHLFGTTKNGGDWSGRLDSRVTTIATSSIPETTIANTRFVESTHKAWVLDLATGLVWSRCPAGQNFLDGRCHQKPIEAERDQAVLVASQVIPGGRLPTVSEFVTLVNCDKKGRTTLVLDGSSQGNFACNSQKSNVNSKIFPGIARVSYSTNNDREHLWTANIAYRDRNYPQVFYVSPGDFMFIRAQFLKCWSPVQCWTSPLLHRVVAVSHISNPQIFSQFESISPDSIRYLQQKIAPTALTWKAQAGVTKIEALPPGLPNPPSLETALLVKTAILAAAYGNHAPPAPKEPIPAEYRANARPQPKGEFETSAQYDERVQKAEALAQAESHQRFSKAMEQYQAAKEAYQKASTSHAQMLAGENFMQDRFAEAWAALAPEVLGDPILTNINYDADRQEFQAKLWGSKGRFISDIRSPVPLARAPQLKPDLESGKIAPKVTFNFPAMSINWELIENTALRTERFKEANDSIVGLENLLREFPNASEAPAARARIVRLIAEEFKRANDDRSKLEALVSQYPRAAEVAAAKKRIDQLRIEEQRQARESEESYRRQREWENSPQAQAKRQATQLCEAQRATCVASCPRDSVFTTLPDTSCRWRCESVSCN